MDMTFATRMSLTISVQTMSAVDTVSTQHPTEYKHRCVATLKQSTVVQC